MARTTVTAIDPTLAGASITYSNADAANGNDVVFNGDLQVVAKNTDGSDHTLTLKANGAKEKGVTIQDQTITIPATSGHKLIDDIPRDYYCQSDGKLQIDWSSATGMTFYVVKK